MATMSTKDILAIQKANDLYTMMDQMWEDCFRAEMSTMHDDNEISLAIQGIRTAIDKAQELVLSKGRGIKIK